MKRVTKNNLIKLVDMKKEYLETREERLLIEINGYIENVINKDKSYYKRLSSYGFNNETLKYLM